MIEEDYIDEYFKEEVRYRRAQDAEVLAVLAADLKDFDDAINIETIINRKYFYKAKNKELMNIPPIPRKQYVSNHSAYNCAYEKLTQFKKANMYNKIKMYFK